jgi:hypothetical protein
MRVHFALALALALAALAPAEPIQYNVVNRDVLEQRLRLAHPDNAVRFTRLKSLFDELGCRGANIREQPVKGSQQPNIICGVPAAEAPRTIIVGAHFDSIGGDGIIDNWSGAVLLPIYAEFMRRAPRRHTFEFVAFAGEEKGLLGSHVYVKSIPKADRARIAAVITIDSIGLTPTKCWPNGSTKELVNDAIAVATALNLRFDGVNVEGVATTDSAVFMEAHIPVLSIHSVTQQTFDRINNKHDVWSAVSWQDYYDTHRLLSALLVYLDQNLP